MSYTIDKNLTPKLKESADYVYAMEYYSNSKPNCKYVLLLEDDSLPSPYWYEKILQAIEALPPSDNWFCLKLFTSFRSYDWLIHMPTVLISALIVLAISFILIRIFYFILYLKYRFILGINRQQTHRSKLIVFIFILNSVLIVALFNARHVSPLGYGVHGFSIGFNTVANVFPRSKLAIIYTYLEATIDAYLAGRVSVFEPKDLALNGFRVRTRLKEFIAEPAVFQHVGLQSSLGGTISWHGISNVQYRPFQSYSFEKEYSKSPISFDPKYWTT